MIIPGISALEKDFWHTRKYFLKWRRSARKIFEKRNVLCIGTPEFRLIRINGKRQFSLFCFVFLTSSHGNKRNRRHPSYSSSTFTVFFFNINTFGLARIRFKRN